MHTCVYASMCACVYVKEKQQGRQTRNLVVASVRETEGEEKKNKFSFLMFLKSSNFKSFPLNSVYNAYLQCFTLPHYPLLLLSHPC